MFSVFRIFTPQLSDIEIAQPDWERYKHDDFSCIWITPTKESVHLRLINPGNWYYPPGDIKAAHAYWESKAQENGGVIVEAGSCVIHGITVSTGIFKYPDARPQALGMMYVGIIWIPFEKFLFQINFEAIEQGTTGAREAAITLLLSQKGELPKPKAEPEMLNSAEELFERLLANRKKIQLLPSDNRQYDKSFPQHPLSKVRTLVDNGPNLIKFSRKLAKQPVYKSV